MTDSEKKLISRTLQLKPVKFSELKDGNDNTLPVLMKLLADTFTTVGERMDETGTRIDDEFIPDLCTFFNNYQELDEKTCIFEVWSYEPGVIPQTLTPDPLKANAVVDTAGHVDDDGEKREFIHIAHVLAYGHSAIVESTRSTGGVYNIQRYLNKMARKAGLGRKGTFFMTDAVTKQLSKEIDRAGGAVGFTVGVTQVDPNSQSALIGLLSNVRGYMPSSGLMTVDWRSKDKLPTKKVIEAYDEAQKQDEVESVIIHLSDGSSIRGLSKFKIKQTVYVEDVGGRNPSQAELKRKMVLYLEELCTPGADGKRILDESGALADNEIFIPNSRRSKKREAGEG